MIIPRPKSLTEIADGLEPGSDLLMVLEGLIKYSAAQFYPRSGASLGQLWVQLDVFDDAVMRWLGMSRAGDHWDNRHKARPMRLDGSL